MALLPYGKSTLRLLSTCIPKTEQMTPDLWTQSAGRSLIQISILIYVYGPTVDEVEIYTVRLEPIGLKPAIWRSDSDHPSDRNSDTRASSTASTARRRLRPCFVVGHPPSIQRGTPVQTLSGTVEKNLLRAPEPDQRA